MSTPAMARIFGMKASVCSWICVTAWKTETARPMTSPTPSSGSATRSASWSAPLTSVMTTSWSIASVEGLDERLGDEVPAVDEDEQQDLERQADEDRRQHDHAHRHQGGADHQVYDQERQEDQEPDLERRLELGDDERRDQRVGGDVGAGARALEVGELHEQREVLRARLLEHELAQRLLTALERHLLRDLVRRQRVDGLFFHRGEG